MNPPQTSNLKPQTSNLEDAEVDVLPRILLEVAHQRIHRPHEIPNVAVEQRVGEQLAGRALAAVELRDHGAELSRRRIERRGETRVVFACRSDVAVSRDYVPL